MCESNVDLARRGFEAVTHGDMDVLGEMLDPDVKWHGSEGETSDSCHNSGEVLSFIARAIQRGLVGELIEVIDAGEQVVVVMRPPGQTKLGANLTTFRQGKVIRMV